MTNTARVFHGPTLLHVAVAVALAALAPACKKEEKVALAPAASALEASKPAPTAMTVAYAIDEAVTTTIDMPAPKEHIKARTTKGGGTLDVDMKNLANTRGEVKIDLTTLTTFTFGDAQKDTSQTNHARTWLEAVVEDKVNEDHRWVTFAIRSIDNVSAADITKVAAMKENGEDVRSATVTAHGDLLLHGRKTAKDVKLAVKLRWPAGASAESAPASVEVRSAEPMRIVLAEHDVKPRDTLGKLAQGSLHLLGTKVADTADVTIDVRAKPRASAPMNGSTAAAAEMRR